MSKKTTIITVRVSPELAQRIALAVQKSGRDQSDILREAVDLGLDDLALVGFDPMAAAKDKIKSLKSPVTPMITSLPDPKPAKNAKQK
jgi:predicted DNA-binding protein